MTQEEKLVLDVQDFWRIHDGLQCYLVDSPAALARWKEHPEDALCDINSADGNGRLLCTRDAYNAIFDIARRQRDSMPIPEDYAVKDIADAIRCRLASVMVQEQQDEKIVTRVLKEAVQDAEKNHVERTFHFPCVITQAQEPEQFRIGPVIFTSAGAFPKFVSAQLKDYVHKGKDMSVAEQRVKRFEEHCSEYGWVATVVVPACSEPSAKARAELAISIAINLLRLVFGIPHSKDMRLAHTNAIQPRKSEFAYEAGEGLHFVWSSRSSGALVSDDWYVRVDKLRSFWSFAGNLLASTLQGKRSETAERAIDAITWFGDAAFENVVGRRIVYFVAALERLTTTEIFMTHRFCGRVAELSVEKDEFDKSYRDARTIYEARCNIVHGSTSPSHENFRAAVRLAHNVTRTALIRFLEIHYLLNRGKQISTLSDLQQFFFQQEAKRSAELAKLSAEYSSKKRQMRPIPKR
jgi:hypothetical protein